MLKFGKLLFISLTLLLIANQTDIFFGKAEANPGAQTGQASISPPTQGTVVETMNAGSYTYVCLENDGQKTWAAVRKTPVKVGDKVEVASGAVMRNFTSKSIGRTFESIIFAQGLTKK